MRLPPGRSRAIPRRSRRKGVRTFFLHHGALIASMRSGACGSGGSTPSLSKLRFARWGTTCGSAARYAGRLRLSGGTRFYTTYIPPRQCAALARREVTVLGGIRPERPSLSANHGAKPLRTSASLDSLGSTLPQLRFRSRRTIDPHAWKTPVPMKSGRNSVAYPIRRLSISG